MRWAHCHSSFVRSLIRRLLCGLPWWWIMHSVSLSWVTLTEELYAKNANPYAELSVYSTKNKKVPFHDGNCLMKSICHQVIGLLSQTISYWVLSVGLCCWPIGQSAAAIAIHGESGVYVAESMYNFYSCHHGHFMSILGNHEVPGQRG